MRISGLLGVILVTAPGCRDILGFEDVVTLPDAPPDASVDAAPVAEGLHYRYVVSREYVPTNNNQAREFGLDLNGDDTVDNQLGMVLGTLSAMGFDTQGTVDRRVDDGGLLTLLDLQTNDFTAMQNAGFTSYHGANPQPPACASVADTLCRRHLAGTGAFMLATTVRDPALVGGIVNGTLTTPQAGKHLQLQIGITERAIPIAVIGARVKVMGMSADGITSAVLAGAVTEDELHMRVIPAMQVGFAAAVALDCIMLSSPPGCGCIPGSTGKTSLDLFDGGLAGSPKDCAVDVAEIEGNSLIQSLFAPDVTIDGYRALSIGIKVEAVPATFAP